MKTFIPPPSLYWIIGRGGLLGSHLEREIKRQEPASVLWSPPRKAQFHWNKAEILKAELEKATTDFAKMAGTEDTWTIIWAAGAGVIGSRPEDLMEETETFSHFLKLLSIHLGDVPGRIFFASSAGAIYAGSSDKPITESTQAKPISEYGRQKLRQEELLAQYLKDHPKVKALIGRISNLYGPGQNLEKPQGLISQLCKTVLTQTPINIYVPLETVRDYLYAGDCAASILRTLNQLQARGWPENPVTKIFASEDPLSIHQVLKLFSRLEVDSLVELKPSQLTPLHPKNLSFKSTLLPDAIPKIPLALGIEFLLVSQEAILGQTNIPVRRAA